MIQIRDNILQQFGDNRSRCQNNDNDDDLNETDCNTEDDDNKYNYVVDPDGNDAKNNNEDMNMDDNT